MYQGMLENVTARVHSAESSYSDMQNLEFRLMLMQNH